MLRNAGMFDPCDTIYIWSCGTENRSRHSTGSHFWKIVYHLLYVNCTFCKFDTLNSNDDWWSHWNVIQSNVHVIHLVWSLSNNDDRDGNENGESAKGFRSTKQFCMCNCAFLYISLLLLHNKKTIFVFLVKEKFANILQIENDGIRGMEFETMWMRIYFFKWQFCCDHHLGCSSSLILVSHYWTIGAKPQRTVRGGGLSCGSIWNLIITFLCLDHLKIPFIKNLQSRFALISFCINHLVLVWLCRISLCCTLNS